MQVIVGGPVASVELLLDGERAAVLRGEPWVARLDLGRELAPHELVARALADDGSELARTRQWLNLPRPPAEVEALLERAEDGRAVSARLSWQSLMGGAPRKVKASFDGRPIAVSPDRRVRIPSYDPEEIHLLTIELEFANDLRSRKDFVLGGRTGAEADSELTSVPVRIPGSRAPALSDLRGLLRRGGAAGPALPLAAIEDGPAIVTVVRDAGSAEAARMLGRFRRSTPIPRWTRTELRLTGGDALRFLWPRPISFSGSSVPAELFPASREYTPKDGGVPWFLTRVYNPAPERAAPRYADAVAVAGLGAYASFQRRAVILLIGREAEDASQYSPEAVTRFLAGLRVPLYVWSLGPPSGAAAAWPEAVDVSDDPEFRRTFAGFQKDLATQRIVWVEGKVLPQEVALSESAGPYSLVR